MDFTNWLGMDNAALREAASQAFGLKDYVRMTDNRFGAFGRESALWIELDTACAQFRAELIKRGLWEGFALEHGMDV